MRKVLTIFLCAALMFSISACKKTDEAPEELVGTRYPNLDNVTVKTDDGEWQIRQGKMYIGTEEIEVGKLTPAETTSLSIIEDCVYVHGTDGLQRYNLSKKSTEHLYYDVMDFSFAGLCSLYYVNSTDLFRIETVDEAVPVSTQVVQDMYLLNGNFFYYVAGDTIKSIDLVSDTVKDLKAITSPVTGISIDDTTLTVETVDGPVTVPLTTSKK